MKNHILSIFLSLLLLTANCAEQKSDDADEDDDDDITTLTFLIEHEPEDDNDHIQIGLTISSKDQSLKHALQKTSQISTSIQSIATDFCEENPKQGFTCGDIVEVEDFQISAQYTKRRKQLLFEEFVVTQQVTIRVDNTDKIGQLGDKILKTQNTKIDSFEWGSNEQNDDQEEAIEAGKKKSEDMCFHLGMKLHRIVSIQAIQQQEEAEGGEGQQQEQQQEEEEGPLVYKFEVECILDDDTAQRKEAQQKLQDQQQIREKQQQEKQKQEKQEQVQKKEKKKKQKKQAPVQKKKSQKK